MTRDNMLAALALAALVATGVIWVVALVVLV